MAFNASLKKKLAKIADKKAFNKRKEAKKKKVKKKAKKTKTTKATKSTKK